jgi:rhodanese-related sulfurtransferase
MPRRQDGGVAEPFARGPRPDPCDPLPEIPLAVAPRGRTAEPMTLSRLILAASLLGALAACAGPSEPPPVKIEQAERQIADGIQLLDVRTRGEWDAGRLGHAKFATVTEDGFLEKAKAQLDPAKPVLVYCRSGKRSAKAVAQLRTAGFTTVHDMAGGIIAWQAAGKPVVK